MPVACSLCAISGGDFKLGPNVGGQVGAEKKLMGRNVFGK